MDEWRVYEAQMNGVPYQRSSAYEDLCQMNGKSPYYCSLPLGHFGPHLALVGHDWRAGEICYNGPWLDDEAMADILCDHLNRLIQEILDE
jgi:hypothetical protein